MTDCIFCKIVNKEIPAHVIYEDQHILAFLDIYPRALGHTMIIPKVHAVTIVDLPEEEIEPIFKAVRKIDDHITTTLKADGLTIGINQGKVSGQEVSHLHIHLMPRFNGDGGGAIQSVVNKPSSEDVAQVAVRLRLNN